MNTILVLTDFTRRAECATLFALQLAIKEKSNLLICHTIERTSPIANGLEVTWPLIDYLQLKNDSVQRLADLSARLEASLSDDEFQPTITCYSEFGLLAEVAGKVIEEKHANMVIMGATKAKSFSRFLFGSHTYSILDSVNCPVLLIPEGDQEIDIKHIAFATDLTFSSEKSLHYLCKLGKPFGASVSVNHISDADFPLSESIQADRSLNHKWNGQPIYYHRIKGDNVKNGLIDMIAAGRVDLLALVHKRYDFLEKLFHPSVSKQMADVAVVPLLVLPYFYSLRIPHHDEHPFRQCAPIR